MADTVLDGLNRYAYVAAQPTIAIDPTGNCYDGAPAAVQTSCNAARTRRSSNVENIGFLNWGMFADLATGKDAADFRGTAAQAADEAGIDAVLLMAVMLQEQGISGAADCAFDAIDAEVTPLSPWGIPFVELSDHKGITNLGFDEYHAAANASGGTIDKSGNAWQRLGYNDEEAIQATAFYLRELQDEIMDIYGTDGPVPGYDTDQITFITYKLGIEPASDPREVVTGALSPGPLFEDGYESFGYFMNQARDIMCPTGCAVVAR